MVKNIAHVIFVGILVSLALSGFHDMLFMPYHELFWDYTLVLFTISLVLFLLILVIMNRRRTVMKNTSISILLSLVVPPAQIGLVVWANGKPELIHTAVIVVVTYILITTTRLQWWVNGYRIIREIAHPHR